MLPCLLPPTTAANLRHRFLETTPTRAKPIPCTVSQHSNIWQQIRAKSSQVGCRALIFL
jgi:hypothetical protein